MTENHAGFILENIALAPLTTLKVGGAARFFAEAKSENAVSEALNFARRENLPIFVLGGGSNLVVSDKGFAGLVLQISLKGVQFTENSVSANAGEDWDEFVKRCVDRDLQGLECLSGIPGTVGGTPVQNVGAYGQEVAQTIESVRVLERETGKILDFSNADCGFAYRTSIFNTTHQEKFIVLRVTFRLRQNGSPNLQYIDLQRFFADKQTVPNLREVRQAVLQIRLAKSMVIDETDINSRSAGSFFKNPIVSRLKLTKVEKTARNLSLISAEQSVPHFVVNETSVKIPAAWLIEKSGFHKGFVRGNVGISAKHTLALINRGNATASEIIEFAGEIQAIINRVFGIELKPEPIFLGIFDK